MLHQLHISDLGVIPDLDLELHPGLNVLTGETGAGKTMVTVGLALATGARGSAQLVRGGAKAARVQARFDAPEGADSWAEDGEVILARTLGADGKGGARISGQLATAGALAELGARLVEVHGQHQSLRLLEPATQTAFLDRFTGAEHLERLAAYRVVFDALREARRELTALEDVSRDRAREADLLGYQVREIRQVNPEPGESERFDAEQSRLAHVERLLELAAAVESALTDDGGGADAMASVVRGLGSVVSLDPELAEVADRAAGLAAEVSELARDIRAYRESLAADPDRLQEVRDRLAALQGLHRKYGATDAEVLAFLADATERLASVEGADERLAGLHERVGALQSEVAERAETIAEARAGAAQRLAVALGAELADLGMPTAALEVRLEPLPEPGPAGSERAALLLSAGAGQPSLPLAKAASGGELSRVMLACRSVLADLDDVPTLIFDEVDAGIGGQAGLAVGRRLAMLAAGRQVLVVTHLPQIACFADRHVRVRKDEGLASVEVLDDHERVVELSRMLAGLEESEHAVSHAEELLAEAARVRAGA